MTSELIKRLHALKLAAAIDRQGNAWQRAAMPHPYFSLDADAADRSSLLVDDSITAGPEGRNFLFGGVGLGVAIAAMEAKSSRPAIWATAQYLSYAPAGSRVSVECVLPSVGKAITQARATLRRADQTEILTATAALGRRDGLSDQWAIMPAIAAPEDCDEVLHWNAANRINGRFRFRLAHGVFGRGMTPERRSDDGRLQIWVQPVEAHGFDRVTLAVIADFVASATSNALGVRAGGNSLDNTIRFAAEADTDWVLCDISIDAIAHGVTHGAMNIFAQNGRLLAIASQSLILRIHPPETPAA